MAASRGRLGSGRAVMRLRDCVSRRPRQDEVRLIHEALSGLDNQSPSTKPLPDPSIIWWKAQYLRRLDLEHEAAAPVEVSDRLHAAIAIVATIVATVAVSQRFPDLAWTAVTALIAVGAFVIILVADSVGRSSSERAPGTSPSPEQRRAP